MSVGHRRKVSGGWILNKSSLEAVESFERWAAGFNSRDADAMIEEMHFPHMRLAGNEFQTWVTAEEFRDP